jgi:hypothetical protein
MPASLAGRNSLIGGGLASSIGGYVDVYSPDSVDGGSTLLDVGRWKICAEFEENPLHCSGLLGASDSRRIGYFYTWELDILFDLRNPPDVLLRSIQDFPVVFWFGDANKSNLVNLNGEAIDGGEAIDDRYYWSPLNKLDSATPVLDAIGKKMVAIHIAGHATGHVFLIPDQGTPDDANTVAGAYSKWLGG